jgi:hypothetical protein
VDAHRVRALSPGEAVGRLPPVVCHRLHGPRSAPGGKSPPPPASRRPPEPQFYRPARLSDPPPGFIRKV